MTYEPMDYWQEAGKDYLTNFQPERYGAQEEALMRMLGRLRFDSVLEIGCGFGRITKLLNGRITGIDPSLDQLLAAARLTHPGPEFVQSTIQDFRADQRWDLVLAVEVLMHIPPDDMQDVANKMRSLSRAHIVTLDWTEPVERQTAVHNFRHDYVALFGKPSEAIRLESQTLYRWSA
jgi:trans-aconitate methyltransferase